ncbi:MAG: lactoylglutathione lyase [Stellaceae bacterium]
MDTQTSSKPAAGIDTSRFRLLHTMIRVFDFDRSIDFYCRLMGMKLLRKREVEAGRYTIAFVGYGDDATHTVVELTYNWDQKEPYTNGSGFGHLAIGVSDIYGTCKALEKEGVKIPRPPGPLKFGIVNIAFIEDPDGNKIELIERG